MGTDGEWLDQVKLLKGECVGRMQIGSGQHRTFAQSPINMDPKNLQIETAIRLTPQTGWACSAREIGAYSTMIPIHKMVYVCSNSYYFDTKFMTKNPWIGKEWLIAMKGVIIGSTDAYLPDAN